VESSITDWAKAKGFKWAPSDIDTMLLRIHSELSEAAEAARDDDMGHVAEELADTFIRLANLAEVLGIDLDAEVQRKMRANTRRPILHGRGRA
jgi:NTP pyrophosphatase (non-canonical NTP hydrolase)